MRGSPFPPLGGRKLYIFPTRHGMVFLLVLLAMLLGSVNYNNNMGFLLTFLLGGIVFTSMIQTYRNLAGIRLAFHSVRPVFEGEPALFQLELSPGGIARLSVRIRFEGETAQMIDLDPGRSQIVAIESQALKRGEHVPRLLLVSSRYPSGIFRCWSPLEHDLSCLVYPKPLEGGSFGSARILGKGEDLGGDKAAGAEDFAGLRQYQPGDSLRRISWKAYSRGQGLQVKNFSGYSGTEVLVDWEEVTGDVETRLGRLCALLLRAEARGFRYGLGLPGKHLSAGSGTRHLENCLKELALFPEREEWK